MSVLGRVLSHLRQEGFCSTVRVSVNYSKRLVKQKTLQYLREELARTPVIWGDESNVKIGHNVILNDTLLNSRSGEIVIEDYAFFGHDVMLITGKHDYTSRGRKRQEEVFSEGNDITVGKGAWIGSRTTVLGPCHIGENAVIGAGSVVVDDIESDTLYAGTPAKLIKELHTTEAARD